MHARIAHTTRAAARTVGTAARLRTFAPQPAHIASSPFASTSRLFRSTAFARDEPKPSPAPIDQQAATELPTEEIPAVSSSLDATKAATSPTTPAEAPYGQEVGAAGDDAAGRGGIDPVAAADEQAPVLETDPEAAMLAEQQSQQDKVARTVFIGGLSWNVDKDWLEDELLKALDITEGINEVRVARDAMGKSKGFAFVELSSPELAQQLTGASAPTIDGRQTQIQASTSGVRAPRAPRTEGRTGVRESKPRNPPAPTIWIGNIPWSADELSVENTFGRYGPISRVKIPKDVETGRSRGVAFVEYETVDAANRALRASQERGISIDKRPVRVDFAAAARGSKPGRRERGTSAAGGRY
ncbi:hypothetical protein JCM9279_007032 [Rhodotorula babjevae]